MAHFGRSARAQPHRPRASGSLLIAIALDAIGLYLVLAALHLIPNAWPASDTPTWTLLAAAVCLFAAARALVLIALRRLLRWRASSTLWSTIASRVPRTR